MEAVKKSCRSCKNLP